jgi:hypothetical protein
LEYVSEGYYWVLSSDYSPGKGRLVCTPDDDMLDEKIKVTYAAQIF